MAGMNIFTLMGSIMIDNKQALDSIAKTEKGAEGLGGKLGKGIVTAGKWGLAIGAAAASAAIAVGGVALKAAVDFEQQMANVATLLDGDVKTKIGNLGETVKKLSKETGTSTELLADGLYQVVSAFGETEDSMEILEVAAKGAAAGNASVTDSVNLLAAVTKGYGDTSAESASKASDLAFLTVKLGQTSFPELAASMGKVIPLAGAMKVSQEELFGAMATLTGVTGGTAEVSTQLRGVIQGMMKPNKQMTEGLEAMGYANGAAALESLGLEGVLKGLKDSVDGNDVALTGMFGSVEAGTAVLALTGSQADDFTEKTNAMRDAAGSTEAAFETQQATVAATMQRIRASINVLTISLGEKLLPVFASFLDWVEEHMPEIEAFAEEAFEVIGEAVMWAWETFDEYLLPIFKDIYEWVKKNWPQISSVIKTAFKSIEVVWTNVLSPVLSFLFDAIVGIIDFVEDNFPGFETTVVSVFEVVGKSLEFVAGLFGGLKKGIEDTLDAWDMWRNRPPDSSEGGSPGGGSGGGGGSGWGGGPARKPVPLATGMNYVPYDNFPALLHKGERVLTADEARGQTINHTGTIRVEGVNTQGELVAVTELIGRQIAQDNRRLPNRASVIPI